jgi:hypothetical protein
MMWLLMNGLDEANHLVIETTLLFFREMMDMKAVQLAIHDNLRKIMKLVRTVIESEIGRSFRSSGTFTCKTTLSGDFSNRFYFNERY